MKKSVVIAEIKPQKRKAFISEEWLKEDNIGKIGYVLDPKNFKGKFND